MIAIQNGAMSADVNADATPSTCVRVDVRGKKLITIRAKGDGTGNPLGVIGVKGHFQESENAASAIAQSHDYGAIGGSRIPDFDGAQPDGSGTAWFVFTEFEAGMDFLEVYYDRTSGGAGNTSLQVVVTAK